MEACTVVLVRRKNLKYKWTSSENEQCTMYVHIACPQILSTITAQWKTILKRQYHQNVYFPELVTSQSPYYNNFVIFKSFQNCGPLLVSMRL